MSRSISRQLAGGRGRHRVNLALLLVFLVLPVLLGGEDERKEDDCAARVDHDPHHSVLRCRRAARRGRQCSVIHSRCCSDSSSRVSSSPCCSCSPSCQRWRADSWRRNFGQVPVCPGFQLDDRDVESGLSEHLVEAGGADVLNLELERVFKLRGQRGHQPLQDHHGFQAPHLVLQRSYPRRRLVLQRHQCGGDPKFVGYQEIQAGQNSLGELRNGDARQAQAEQQLGCRNHSERLLGKLTGMPIETGDGLERGVAGDVDRDFCRRQARGL
mmetsp:Transcript_18175/g.41243  ORF Transcript_18175/g.41243 Transcript_18175/m.41243 type:complete len:270 (-) Transcript_18175:926-1735(-)